MGRTALLDSDGFLGQMIGLSCLPTRLRSSCSNTDDAHNGFKPWPLMPIQPVNFNNLSLFAQLIEIKIAATSSSDSLSARLYSISPKSRTSHLLPKDKTARLVADISLLLLGTLQDDEGAVKAIAKRAWDGFGRNVATFIKVSRGICRLVSGEAVLWRFCLPAVSGMVSCRIIPQGISWMMPLFFFLQGVIGLKWKWVG